MPMNGRWVAARRPVPCSPESKTRECEGNCCVYTVQQNRSGQKPWAQPRLLPFSPVTLRVLQLTSNGNLQLHDLNELITSDPVLASEISNMWLGTAGWTASMHNEGRLRRAGLRCVMSTPTGTRNALGQPRLCAKAYPEQSSASRLHAVADLSFSYLRPVLA
jgi:hypothetical protein